MTAAIEHLNALVTLVRDVDIALGVGGKRMGRVELPSVGSSRSPREEESSVPVELRDACVRSVTVGDEDVAFAVPGDVARTGELVTGAASARRSPSSALPCAVSSV